MNSDNADLRFHLRSMSRFIYYVTEEEDRFLKNLHAIMMSSAKLAPTIRERVKVYNQAYGIVSILDILNEWKTPFIQPNGSDIVSSLTSIIRDNSGTNRNFYVITDPDLWLKDQIVVRRLLNLAHQLHNNDAWVKVIIFVGPEITIPLKLQRYIEVVRDKGLTEEEIAELVGHICSRVNIRMPENIVDSFKGLTSFEIGAAISQSIVLTRHDSVSPKRIDPGLIRGYKYRQLKKTDLLSVVDTSGVSFDEVGGLDRFKDWVRKHKSSWTPEGQRFGLKPPRGLLLVGVWGCGKSLSVKALGNCWGLPVVHFEMGKLRQSAVGASETNVYKAITIIESLSPCIVFMDEAEKSLSGGASSALTDGGLTSRMIGILSTWLQETKAPVCLVMTANTLEHLPNEFVRRTNERFFFNLPQTEERVDILKIHLKKAGQNPDKYKLFDLAEEAKLMVGDEIEKSIQEAMTESFVAGKPCLDEEILTHQLRKKPRIYKTLAEDIRKVMSWVGFDEETQDGIRARLASTPPKDKTWLDGL